MKRLAMVLAATLVASLLCHSLPRAQAEPPDRLTSYRFLPRHSELHVSGGFAGFDFASPIRGGFGLVEGFRFGETPQGEYSLTPYAAFTDVDAAWRFPQPTVSTSDATSIDRGQDLDATLNLSGLDGRQLPLGAPFDAFQFKGVDGQGAAMQVQALQFGPWLYMVGANDPGPGTADYFNYEIRALARQTRFADLNQDDVVDGGDLALWQSGFGENVLGDVDESGATNGSDFLALQRQQGERAPSFAELDAMLVAAASGAVAAVPEPGTLALVGLGLLLVGSRRRPLTMRWR